MFGFVSRTADVKRNIPKRCRATVLQNRPGCRDRVSATNGTEEVPDMTRSVVVALVLFAGQARSADWPQFLGSTRDAHSSEKGLLRSFPKKGPTVVWEKDVGEGYSAPVILGEQLFLFHRVGDKDVIDCLDAANGKSRWSFSYANDYSDR